MNTSGVQMHLATAWACHAAAESAQRCCAASTPVAGCLLGGSVGESAADDDVAGSALSCTCSGASEQTTSLALCCCASAAWSREALLTEGEWSAGLAPAHCCRDKSCMLDRRKRRFSERRTLLTVQSLDWPKKQQHCWEFNNAAFVRWDAE